MSANEATVEASYQISAALDLQPEGGEYAALSLRADDIRSSAIECPEHLRAAP